MWDGEELTFNQAVAWEYKGDYKKALEILESYDQKYTAEGNAARELAFLKPVRATIRRNIWQNYLI